MSISLRYSLALLAFALPVTAAAQELQLKSSLLGFQIRALTTMPANPDKIPFDTLSCSVLLDQPETAAGRVVRQQGWGVAGEQQQGDYTFVSFAGEVGQGTSGGCELTKANVGIFQGDRPVAVIYTAGTEEDEFGPLRLIEPEGIRIWNGAMLPQPVGDLHLREGTITLTPVAERDSFCGGRVTVPSLYNLPIDRVQELVKAEGWRAKEPDADTLAQRVDWVKEMADEGFPEIQDCAGTGFNYCGFDYQNDSGDVLEVTTAGERYEGSGPDVSSYGVTCG